MLYSIKRKYDEVSIFEKKDGYNLTENINHLYKILENIYKSGKLKGDYYPNEIK